MSETYNPVRNGHDSYVESIKAVGAMMRRQCLRETHGYCVLCGEECRRPKWLNDKR